LPALDRPEFLYDSSVLKLLTAPVTNDRSPRYMERALAAIHQAHRLDEPVTFMYGSVTGRGGLFVQFPDPLEELVTGPIAANYPNCTLATVEGLDGPPPGWNTWSAELELTPEIFPILRHSQFENLLNGTYADPVSAILRAVKPEEGILCSVGIHLVPVRRYRHRTAERAIRLLDREFFRQHHRFAEYYAKHAIVFDAAAEHVVPFNPRACPGPNRVDPVTSGVVSAFKKLYDSW
jgi:hypothetical protein